MEDIKRIEDNADKRIKSASLLGSIYEGCEHIAQEIMNQEKETMNTVHEPVAALRMNPVQVPWEGVTVTQKNEKSCIWVAGNTKPYAEELKSLGYRWSRKRMAWYLKPQAA